MIYKVSPHVLAEVQSCGVRGWVRHVMGYTSVGDSIKASAGSAYHAGMAVFLDPALTVEDITQTAPHNDSDVVTFSRPPTAPERRARALAALHAVYDPVWANCPPDKLEEGYTPQNLHKLFDRWMEMHPPTNVPWQKVMAVETAFVSRQWQVMNGTTPYDFTLHEHPLSVQLTPGDIQANDFVQLIVRPDAVVIDAAGLYRYVDTKTTGWRVKDPVWLRNLRLSFQTQLYADAVAQKYGDKAMLGGWINACEIKKLPGQSAPKFKQDGSPAKIPPCPTHKKPYAECGIEHMESVMQECLATPDSIEWALALAKIAATRFVKLQRQHQTLAPKVDVTDEAWEQYPIKNIPADGIANEKCRFCPAGEWCDSGRVIRALPSFMAFDPWPVEEGMRVHAA